MVHDMKISFVKLGQQECDKYEEFNLHDPHHKQDSLSNILFAKIGPSI